MKLFNIDKYLLLIDENGKIKDRGICLCYDKLTKEPHLDYFYEEDWDYYVYKPSCILAYYPLLEDAKELDLPLLPPFEEKLIYSEDWEDYWQYKTGLKELKDNADADFEKRTAATDKMSHRFGYVYGAKSIEDKLIPIIQKLKAAQQFSLEDMKKAFNAARETSGINARNQMGKKYKTFNDFIQSLSTQQLPKEFIPSYKIDCVKVNCNGECIECNYMEKVLKTITNSEGKQEIQGRYVY